MKCNRLGSSIGFEYNVVLFFRITLYRLLIKIRDSSGKNTFDMNTETEITLNRYSEISKLMCPDPEIII